MSEQLVSGRIQRRQTVQKNVALYPIDVEAVERLQEHHKLDSFSQAVRRAIRDAVEIVDRQEQEAQAA